MPNQRNQPLASPDEEIGVRYVTIKDVTQMYDISERTLFRWMNEEKRLPAIRDVAGHVRMDLEDVKRVVKLRNVAPNPLYEQVQDLQARVDQLDHLLVDLRSRVEALPGKNEDSQQLLGALPSRRSAKGGEKGEHRSRSTSKRRSEP